MLVQCHARMHMTKFQAILGSWSFTRSIVENVCNTHYTAQGQLSITRDTWFERGVMNGMSFHQRYCLSMDCGFSVMFADGSAFYNLQDIHQPQCMHHTCSKDTYKGTWLLQERRLTLRWDVMGPRKNYSTTTRYCKLADATP